MVEMDDINYWPSFVDVMSSVFIVILTIFFMLFLSQQYLSYLVGKGEKDLRELKIILDNKKFTSSGVQVTKDGRIKIGENVLFGFGVDKLTLQGQKLIDSVGTSLQTFFSLDPSRKKKFSIVVEGHTDTFGSSASNQDLSFRRAKNVTDYWENKLKFGTQSDTIYDIFPAGYGESRLAVFTNDNVRNEENRRVEIRVVPKFDKMLSEILNHGK